MCDSQPGKTLAGELAVPDRPNLGIDVAQAALRRYRAKVAIKVGRRTLHVTSPTG